MEMNVRLLRKLGACNESIEEYKKQKPKTVLECFDLLIQQARIDWANWFITRILSRDNKIRYSIYAAGQRINTYEEKHPNDTRPRDAINAAKRVLKNNTKETREAAESAADLVARSEDYAADSAAYSAYSAAFSVDSEDDSARSAAYSARSAALSARAEVYSARTEAYSVIMLKIIRYGIRLFKKQEAAK